MTFIKISSVTVCVCFLALNGCKDELTGPHTLQPDANQNVAGVAPATDVIPTYSQERPGTFIDLPDSTLWRHVEYSDRIAVVGLRKPGMNRGVYRGRVLMDRAEWKRGQSRDHLTTRRGVDMG
jgi:hypothetical protein